MFDYEHTIDFFLKVLKKSLCVLSIIVLRTKENQNRAKSESAAQTFKMVVAGQSLHKFSRLGNKNEIKH